MYAHRTIQTINGLHIELDLPTEFSGCEIAEVIVLPLKSQQPTAKNWEEKVMSLAGLLSDDFPDDIDDSDLGEDNPRHLLE